MKAIITGGAGFIGSHLAEELAIRGYTVIVLDDLSTGKIENIAGLLTSGDKEKFKFIQGNILDLALLREVFQGVDIIFHQAARTGVAQSIEDPLTTHDVNVLAR